MSDNTQFKPKSKNKPKKSATKIDKLTLIFYVLMLVGLLFFTVLLVIKSSNSKTYTSKFDNIVSTITIKDTDVILNVEVDGKLVSTQNATYIQDKSTAQSEKTIYTLNFDDTKDTVNMQIKEDKVVIIYEDGTKVTYKEN